MQRLTASRTSSSSCQLRRRGTASITSSFLSGLITDPGKSSTPLCCCWIIRELPFFPSPPDTGIRHCSCRPSTQHKAAEAELHYSSHRYISTAAHGDSNHVFSNKENKKGSNQLLQTVTIATSSALNLHISKRGEKMKRSDSLKNG